MKKLPISTALELAQNLRNSPAMFVDEQTSKDTIAALYDAIATNPCFMSAILKGKETFCLTSGDRCAPDAIEAWAGLAAVAGANPSKVLDAHETAARWRREFAAIAKTPD